MSKLNKHLKKECKQIRYLEKFGIPWNKLHIGNNHVQSSNVASFWNMLANMKDILDSEATLIQLHSCGCSTYVFWTLADIPVCNIPDNSKYYFDVIEYVSFWNISLFLFREKLRIWSWIDWIFSPIFHSKQKHQHKRIFGNSKDQIFFSIKTIGKLWKKPEFP